MSHLLCCALATRYTSDMTRRELNALATAIAALGGLVWLTGLVLVIVSISVAGVITGGAGGLLLLAASIPAVLAVER